MKRTIRTRRFQRAEKQPGSQSRPSPIARTTPTICDLPSDVIDKIFLYLLDTPDNSRCLEHRTLEEAEHAYQFATTCRRFYAHFRRAVHALALDWDSPVYINALARLFSPSLRSVTVRSHPLSTLFLRTLSASPGPLKELHLSNCAVPDALITLARTTRHTLRVLDLQFISAPDISRLVEAFSCHLTKLQTIVLRGISSLDHKALITLIAASASQLRSVSLRTLRHASIRDRTLHEISRLCTGLTSLFLEDIRHAEPTAVELACVHVAASLESLRLYNCNLTESMLRTVLAACTSLRQFGLEEGAESRLHASAVVACLSSISTNLELLHLRGIHNLSDPDVLGIIYKSPNLKDLSIRRASALTDSSVFYITTLGHQLTSLDLRGCFITNEALLSIGKRCTNLRSLSLGGDGQDVSEEGARRLGDEAINNHGIDTVLRGSGPKLQAFMWETPRRIVRGVTGRDYSSAVGVANLHAKSVAKSLKRYCPNLRMVEVNGLRPPVRHRVERAKCDLAFIELEESVRHVVVFLDREEPF